MITKDMEVLEFSRKISMLTLDTPLSIEFDREHGQNRKRWWACQREHITVWCLQYPTNGEKGFKHKPSNSSKDMYNRFGRPETLIWLAEALWEDSKVIKAVIEKIKGKTPKTACGIIRENIPYERILEMLEQQI